MTSSCPNDKYLDKYFSDTENFGFHCLNSGGVEVMVVLVQALVVVVLLRATVLVVTRDLPGVKVSTDEHQKEILLKEEIQNSHVGGYGFTLIASVREIL